ncbi:CcoQ/FixQ family Cbb3-type cytochrome c oxidase assembly chaperone [Chitinophaga solisilvae]|uniref:CcoQ/FixQ family Cbb3-type cytochrome c oxidase assembly chaperone n=1 Tax=Chitinophaga solisilvae TaxID=1233460 RepID=A0A433WJK9_9BACT|nr:CcoQ/FixQ family Cbb3-type cytochrome c oxidase assembly chaperone [Chitinophaga solisilvae]NSL89381.1 CcoQ/FixQ family Cbb3-type cytochrome c oxidase assembly chaperone [Chitinophaga solisilvae]
MKFINYLESIAGVSIYPLASLLIFTIFFTVASMWAFSASKKMMDHVSRIPLDNDDTQSL